MEPRKGETWESNATRRRYRIDDFFDHMTAGRQVVCTDVESGRKVRIPVSQFGRGQQGYRRVENTLA